ncbi:hypothetical protein MKW98_015449 [Papaver atlanticum]|uniref:Uncharacterized protein n=1 Tax=Papaver atlanticum TaxID=357466 RepID=A0AAD4RZ09_9MAGN|nr:hypothetical protein MKW98_015449 [Papaver atlanticum]
MAFLLVEIHQNRIKWMRKVVEDPFGGQYEGDEATCRARYMGSDAACGDQMGMEDEAMNMHVGSKMKDSHENDYDMSIPPQETSSDDYSDYYASDNDELLNETPVLSSSAKKNYKKTHMV